MNNFMQGKRFPQMEAIWETLYHIEIPWKFNISIADARARGVPTSGDEDIDKSMMESYTSTYRTINEMLEFWKQGCDISVVNYDDTKKIYDAIHAHLTAWAGYMTNSVHLAACPFDDLLDLDTFANLVYDKAKYVFTPEMARTILGTGNSLGLDLNPNNLFVKRGHARFQHLSLTDQEKRQEQDGFGSPVYFERQGFGEHFMSVASRFDIRGRDTIRKDVRVVPGNKNIQAGLGNNKSW